MASVIARGDVRALCLDRLNFESLLRERPEVSLAVMRDLCHRLKELIDIFPKHNHAIKKNERKHRLFHNAPPTIYFHNFANSFNDL